MAGVATAWVAETMTGRQPTAIPPEATRAQAFYVRMGGGLTVACACLAAAPDLDLFLGWRFHRTVTHSLGAALTVTVVAALYAAWRRKPVAYTSLTCGAAYATHILLDWLGADPTPPYGIMALWPFSHRWFISGWSLFDAVSRRYWLPHEFLWGNLLNAGWEVLVLGPVLLVLWLVRVKALARLPAEVPGGHHAAE